MLHRGTQRCEFHSGAAKPGQSSADFRPVQRARLVQYLAAQGSVVGVFGRLGITAHERPAKYGGNLVRTRPDFQMA
jgi:hypothetical protein